MVSGAVHSQDWQFELCIMLPQAFEALHDLICCPRAQRSHKVQLIIHVIFHLQFAAEDEAIRTTRLCASNLMQFYLADGNNTGKRAGDMLDSVATSVIAAARVTEAAYHFWVWTHVLRLDSRHQPGSGRKSPQQATKWCLQPTYALCFGACQMSQTCTSS